MRAFTMYVGSAPTELTTLERMPRLAPSYSAISIWVSVSEGHRKDASSKISSSVDPCTPARFRMDWITTEIGSSQSTVLWWHRSRGHNNTSVKLDGTLQHAVL